MRRIGTQFAQSSGASPSPSLSRSASLPLREKSQHDLAPCFLIWEIPTHVVRCIIPADGDGNMPVEHVAAMLAMHCLALNRRLDDFQVLALPQSALPPEVAERARQLIAAGRSIGSGVKLSPPQRAVLECVVQNFSNKEIASQLDVSVRTVKFHVSSLLAKFGVPNRIALARKAAVAQISRSWPEDLVSDTHGGSATELGASWEVSLDVAGR